VVAESVFASVLRKPTKSSLVISESSISARGPNTYDSDNNGSLDSGGFLYIYPGTAFDGPTVPAPTPEVIDLGGAISAAIKTSTGSAPVRPHFVSFNRAGTHAIITFVATGHVVIVRASDRQVVYAVDVGTQAHAANAAPDDTYILVANQNGKLVQRIDTNYLTETYALDALATLDLASGLTPSGAARENASTWPDNAAVLTFPEQANGDLAFVTLRTGVRIPPSALLIYRELRRKRLKGNNESNNMLADAADANFVAEDRASESN
jgi:hypothetical protein